MKFVKFATILIGLLLILATVALGVEAEHGTDAGHSGPPHLPSFVGMLSEATGWTWLEHWVNVIYAFLIAGIFSIVAVMVSRKKDMVPGPFQNFMEICVEGMYNFIYSILGKDARRYVPFLGTLFFYILAMNLMGLVPGGHSPSTSINITASLAILVFLYSQYIGISRQGFGGWVDHLIGAPRDVVSWALVPLMLPLHIIGELAKPFSLAVRLFGNITGEDVLVAAFVGLGLAIMSGLHSPIGLPINIPFILLGTLLSIIQALVFTLLSTIYILMMLPHHEHEPDAHH
uniref:ATP synthase subunit a n=1 Tax=uncultured bacterium pAW1 TaxID=1781155 RepID=A0A1C9U4S8_9BACT|nr:ATP synthase subunit A [uncultured bacterium pAW1]